MFLSNLCCCFLVFFPDAPSWIHSLLRRSRIYTHTHTHKHTHTHTQTHTHRHRHTNSQADTHTHTHTHTQTVRRIDIPESTPPNIPIHYYNFYNLLLLIPTMNAL